MTPSEWDRVFSSLPGVYELIDANTYTLLGVSNDLLRMVQMERGVVVGKNLFEAFPPFPGTDVRTIQDAFERVKSTKTFDILPPVRYDVGVKKFVWLIASIPVLSADESRVEFIVIHAENVTALDALGDMANSMGTLSGSLSAAVSVLIDVNAVKLRSS